MKNIKQAVIVGLCLVVLASAASAGLQAPVKVTGAQVRNILKSCRTGGAPSPSLTPAEFRKKLLGSRPASPTPLPPISVDKHYAAIPLVSISGYPAGIGVGTLGDYVLINDEEYGDLLAYKDGTVKYLGTPGSWLIAGRMYGHYYFGDAYGNLFRLENDLTITDLLATDDFGDLVGAIAIEPTHGYVFFAIDFISDEVFALFAYDPATTDYYFMGIEPDYCLGLAFKGNYLYISLAISDVILKWNWKSGGSEPLLFTDKVVTPLDIQFDAKGNLFVAEGEPGDILKFNATATMRTKIAWNVPGPECLGLDKAGDVFFSDEAGEVWKLKKK